MNSSTGHQKHNLLRRNWSDFLKIKNFHSAKGSLLGGFLKKVTGWKKIFTNHIYDKDSWPVSRIHKELLKLSDNKIRNSVKKINKTFEYSSHRIRYTDVK